MTNNAMSDLQQYLDNNADVSTTLGHVLLYSCSKTLVEYNALKAILDQHGLSQYAPYRPGDADAFRRTSKEQERTRVETDDPDTYLNVMVRDVTTTDDEQLLRQIVEERVDGKGAKLGYLPVADVRFDRSTATVSVRTIAEASDAAKEVGRDILAAYDRERGCVTGGHIRNTISRVLDGCHSIQVRPGGGAYFVSKVHNRSVAALEALSKVVPGCYVHAIPLPDDTKQRAMLTTSIEEESRADVERTMKEVRDILVGNEAVSPAKLTSYLNAYRFQKEKASAYCDLLETELGATNTALDLLQRQLAVLANRVT